MIDDGTLIFDVKAVMENGSVEIFCIEAESKEEAISKVLLFKNVSSVKSCIYHSI